jgi:hypothetical protein
MVSLNSSKWLEAMEDHELRSMSSNKVRDLVEISDGVKPIGRSRSTKLNMTSKGRWKVQGKACSKRLYADRKD